MSCEIAGWQRDLHRIPETGLHLPETADYIHRCLNRIGIEEITSFERHSGLMAVIEGKRPGATVALRADMDGLPIEERTGLDYASCHPGAMHACGHDGHMAMLLGAAKLLHSVSKEMAGTVKLLFQPAEESVGGARLMIEDGVLENPEVNVIFGQHCGSIVKGLPKASIAAKKGAEMASQDSFRITIYGKAGHGAIPAESVDPIVISAQMISAMQTLVSRECNASDSAGLSVGSIHSGDTYNIIPETAVMVGSIRCLNEELRARLLKRIQELVAGIAAAMGGRAEVVYMQQYPVTCNDPALTEFILKEAEKLFGQEKTVELSEATMVSEDMSEFLRRVPGVFWFFSTPAKEDVDAQHHTPFFKIDSSLLWQGSLMQAQCAWDYLEGKAMC